MWNKIKGLETKTKMIATIVASVGAITTAWVAWDFPTPVSSAEFERSFSITRDVGFDYLSNEKYRSYKFELEQQRQLDRTTDPSQRQLIDKALELNKKRQLEIEDLTNKLNRRRKRY